MVIRYLLTEFRGTNKFLLQRKYIYILDIKVGKYTKGKDNISTKTENQNT